MDAAAASAMFQRCLERCCARANAPRGSSGCRQAALAATCLLRLGHAGRALKLASRALFLAPQDEHRQLVRQCTKELEYQGRVEAMQAALADCGSVASMPGAAGIVARLLQQLQRAGEEGAAEALRTLAKELVRGSIDAQIAFDLLRGYEQVMRFWTGSHFSDATQALVSAGVCQLYTVLQPGVTDQELLAMVTGTGAGGKRNGIRVRWPVVVLQQLLATVTAQATGSWPNMAACALRLLTLAALDPHQRQLSLSSCPVPAASSPSPDPAADLDILAPSLVIARQSSAGADADPVSNVLDLLVNQLEATLCLSDPQSDAATELHSSSQDNLLHSSEDNLQSSQDIDMQQLFPDAPQRRRVMRSESAVGMQLPEREDSAAMHGPAAMQRPPPSVSEGSEADSWPASRFDSSGSGGGSDGNCLLTQLLDATWQASWLPALPPQDRVLLSRIVSSYAAGSKFDRLVLRQASERRGTLATLLHLYQVLRLDSCSSAGEGTDKAAASTSAACGRLLLTALLSLCRQEPSLLRAEGFVCRQRKAPASAHRQTRSEDWASSGQSYASCSPAFAGSTASPSQTVLVPTPLLGQLMQMAKQEMELFELSSADGQQDAASKAAPAAASPFGLQASPGIASASPSGLLEGWVSLLTAVAQAGKVNARELHRCRLLDFLHDVSECSSAPALAEAVETAYGMCARQCQEMTQAMFDSKSVVALMGIARYSGQSSLVLVALDRLTPLVGRCSSAEYLRVAQQTGGGVLAAAHQLMLMSLSARKAKSAAGDQAASGGGEPSGSGPAAAAAAKPGTAGVKHMHPWDAALAAATEATQVTMPGFMGFGAAVKLPPPPPVPDFSLPQAGALRDAAQCLLLACLDRSRRQFGLKPMQAPRDGYWASVRPRDLLMLERRLREDWAAAMLPKLAWQTTPVAQQGCAGNSSEAQAQQVPSMPEAAKQAPEPCPAPVEAGETACCAPGQVAAVVQEAPASEEPQAGALSEAVEQVAAAECEEPSEPRSPEHSEVAAEVVGVSATPEPEQAAGPGHVPVPLPLLRSRRSDSLEDTAHKDSCHTSLHSPIASKALADLLDAPEGAPLCSSD